MIRQYYWISVFLVLFTHQGWAKNVVYNSLCELNTNVWHLTNTTNIKLTKEAIQALKSGITLYFVYDIEFRARRHWFADKKLWQYPLQLRFNHITNLYLLQNTITKKRQSFTTLNDTLHALGTVQNLPLFDTSSLQDINGYDIYVRFRLQQEKLPVSLRLSTLFSRSWDINSDWEKCKIIL